MKSVLSEIHYHSEEAAYAYVESRIWPDGPVCTHCGATKEHVGRLSGKTTRIGLYKCYGCRQPFNVKIGTVFEKSHVPMRHWLQTMYLMTASKKGISTRQIQRTLQCSMKTAWFLTHRVREAMAELRIGDTDPLGGVNRVVESDETFVGGKAANRKGKIPPKAPVLALVERDGRVRSFHILNVTAQTLRPIMTANVDRASYLITDESPVYWSIGRQFAGHGAVNHSAEEYVRAYFWHTNTAENYFSILKRGIYGCYFHVSEAHLHRYTAEFDFRYNNRIALGVDDIERTDRVIRGVVGKRLTYRTARGSQTSEPPF